MPPARGRRRSSGCAMSVSTLGAGECDAVAARVKTRAHQSLLPGRILAAVEDAALGAAFIEVAAGIAIALLAHQAGSFRAAHLLPFLRGVAFADRREPRADRRARLADDLVGVLGRPGGGGGRAARGGKQPKRDEAEHGSSPLLAGGGCAKASPAASAPRDAHAFKPSRLPRRPAGRR